MNRHDTLVHPPWNLTCIVVWVVAFESKLSALSIFPWNLARRSNLRRCAHTLLDLLNLLRLHIEGLVDTFAILHLLHFISIWDGSCLLYWVNARIALGIRDCVVEVYCVCCHSVHLVFACLAKAIRIYVGQLKWLWHANLSTFTRSNNPSRMVMTMLSVR